MILFYAFDREMLNAAGFLEADRDGQRYFETIIEKELKLLILFMPLEERIIISPSFRFESLICRKVLERNRAFVENGVIAEYMRETSLKDFWIKKEETYKTAMSIDEAYAIAYGQEATYKEISQMRMARIPKQEVIGVTSRDAFMVNVKERGKKFGVPQEQIENVLKITDETKESTFLWEVEEAMLYKYGVPKNIIYRLGIRESMNQSYLHFFTDQSIQICKSSLGIIDVGHIDSPYDMWRIKSIFERLGILEYVQSLSAENILLLRRNLELQNILDVIRKNLDQKISDINKEVTRLGDMQSMIVNILTHSLGGNRMTDSDILFNKLSETEILQEGTIRILHLSDLHFTDEETMRKHYFYLKLDLEKSFHVQEINYLIISGDVTDRPNKSMYNAAFSFVQILMQDFNISAEHIIILPGNHDCDRDISKRAYGNKKNITNHDEYNKRYSGYSKYFYEPITGKPYPLEPQKQFEDYIFEHDSLCILGLNSCWQIDHKHTERSSICMEAIQNSKSIWCNANDYVKLAVWHHPLSGWAPIQDTTFMDTLAVAGFKACLHGHIHEATNNLFTYDANKNIRMIGAGTFGAVNKERGDGIPRQYNMIEFDKNKRIMWVHTRKREKDDGIWQADARWGDKNSKPESFYTVYF